MWTSLWRAALFTIMFLPGTIILPLLLAILIDRVSNPLTATFYRVILLIPAVIPSTLIFVLWKWMYNYQSGPINHLLVDTLGPVHACRTRRNGSAERRSRCPRSRSWKSGGASAITRSSSSRDWRRFQRICPDAARIDGASEWQVFWHVTRPQLAPIMMILVVLRFGTAMAVIDEYLIFGGFNRASPTYTWTIFMYDQAFKLGLWRQGYASAIGMIGAVAMMIVMVVPAAHFPAEGMTQR